VILLNQAILIWVRVDDSNCLQVQESAGFSIFDGFWAQKVLNTSHLLRQQILKIYFQIIFSKFVCKVKLKMKKLILNLFLYFFPFSIISFIVLCFILPAYEATYWFFFFVCAYPLLCISILCFTQLVNFPQLKRIVYSSFSPVIVVLYAYSVIVSYFIYQQDYQPYLIIFQILMLISSIYFIFLLFKSPIKWYFKLVVFSYLLFMPCLYIIGLWLCNIVSVKLV